MLEPGIPKAAEVLKKNSLPESEENLFIVSSCEEKGLDFLLGKGKNLIRKKTEEVKKDSINSDVKITADEIPLSEAPKSETRDYSITVDGRVYEVQVRHSGTLSANSAQASERIPFSSQNAIASSSIDIPAPTPGNIVRIDVTVGEKILKDQVLLVMEAMKMESEVKSSQSGIVQKINVQSGDTVHAGDVLIILGK